MNNKILSLALAISQVMRSFLIFMLFVVLGFGVILIIDAESIPFLRYSDGTFNFSGQGAEAEGVQPQGAIMIFTMLKLAFTILCSIFLFNEALKVIRSIRSLDTFKKQNIASFRRMAMIFLILFVANMFSFYENGEQLAFRFSLPLNYLLAVIGCYILAEIFKEGNKLMEENQLTI
jgi:hypothetical protein